MNEPKILFYDLETFPNTGYFWAGRLYETNIIEVKEYGGLASVAWSWNNEKTIHCLTREGHNDDKHIVKKLVELFNEADVVVAHNGISFDNKTSNTNILKHSLVPPAPVKIIDTKNIAKKYFRFDSNSLDALANFLNVGRKLKHEGFNMWKECLENDSPQAWQKMGKYNKHDVFLLRGVYYKLVPWISNTINAAIITERPNICPKPGCGGTKFQSRGFATTPTQKYRRFQCGKCGGWCRAQSNIKTAKPGYK